MQQTSITFNSDPATGATPIGVDGSRFSVNLNSPLAFPRMTTSYVQACVLQASIWNTSPNVSPAFRNNQLTFATSNTAPGIYTVILPQGLYSLSGIGNFIQTSLVNLGLPGNLIQLSGDDATQKVVVSLLTAGDSIDFAAPNSIGALLGFSTAAVDNPIVALVANYNAYGDTTASLNRNNSYRIRSNMVAAGIPTNAIANGIIAEIPINVGPGNQINYSPQNVLWFDASDLIGQGVQSIDFFLENQAGQQTPTGDEYWSFTIGFKYSTR